MIDWANIEPFQWMFSRAWEAVIFFLCLFVAFYPTGVVKSWEFFLGGGR